ncbi:MAG: hypothetical protein LBQ54_10130 [Planctomycetaceae bacterium]|jgi:hypothetical protein|nr:hypothetical protein [Planctomycetaceae bacterium]
MRQFRDRYLLSLPDGQAMYDEYYRVAPAIVEAIEHCAERSPILKDIFVKVRQCVQCFEAGNNEKALDVYVTMFNSLKDKFIKD